MFKYEKYGESQQRSGDTKMQVVVCILEILKHLLKGKVHAIRKTPPTLLCQMRQ